MKLQRFFIDPDAVLGNEVILGDKDIISQIKNVLRLRAGDKVIFLDGTGKEYIAVIKEISNSAINCGIESLAENKNEPELKIILCQALCKKDKFEWVLQKGTEAGVSEFIPILAERSEKFGLNRERAEKILKESAEQSERGVVPKLHDIQKFSDYILSLSKDEDVIILDKSGKNIKHYTLTPKPYTLNVFIGPEGGWTSEELAFAKENGAEVVSLGKTVLRTETAGLVAASILLNK